MEIGPGVGVGIGAGVGIGVGVEVGAVVGVVHRVGLELLLGHRVGGAVVLSLIGPLCTRR